MTRLELESASSQPPTHPARDERITIGVDLARNKTAHAVHWGTQVHHLREQLNLPARLSRLRRPVLVHVTRAPHREAPTGKVNVSPAEPCTLRRPQARPEQREHERVIRRMQPPAIAGFAAAGMKPEPLASKPVADSRALIRGKRIRLRWVPGRVTRRMR